MSANTLEVTEGVQYQTSDDILTYTITTTNTASSPSSATAKAYDESVDKDVTSTVFPTNSPSVSGDVITLSPLRALTTDHSYRIEVTFVVGADTYKRYFRVKCQY